MGSNILSSGILQKYFPKKTCKLSAHPGAILSLLSDNIDDVVYLPGLTKHCGTDNIAVILNISLLQLCSHDATNIFDN